MIETGGVLTCQIPAVYRATSGCTTFMGKTRKNMSSRKLNSDLSTPPAYYKMVESRQSYINLI